MNEINQGKNLHIIIITHNRLDYPKRTLESLLKTVPLASFVVYDNASTDATRGYLDYMARIHSNINFCVDIKNLGWGAAVNFVMRAYPVLDKDYLLISNNDVEYHDRWYEKCLELYIKYPKIGILGVWQHTAHGIREDFGDLVVKDTTPAVGWLLKPNIVKEIGAFPENGPCYTKGGNGEDVGYTIMAQNKGYWVVNPKNDVANHITGY